MAVVEFPGKKLTPEDQPHIAGEFFCGACDHTWVGVAPIGEHDCTECPNCKRLWGSSKHMVLPPNAMWRCNCGETLFWLTPTGVLCRRCGLRPTDWAR